MIIIIPTLLILIIHPILWFSLPIVLGALVVTLRQGNFKLKEEGLLEKVLTGSDPDPYVIISVLEDEYTTPPENIATRLYKMFTKEIKDEETSKKLKKSSFARVMDSGVSEKKVRTCFYFPFLLFSVRFLQLYRYTVSDIHFSLILTPTLSPISTLSTISNHTHKIIRLHSLGIDPSTLDSLLSSPVIPVYYPFNTPVTPL